MEKRIEHLEITPEELDQILLDAKAGTLSEESYSKLEKLVASFAYMSDLIAEKGTTIAKLRHLLFGPKSERLRELLRSREKDEANATAEGEREGAEPRGGESPEGASAGSQGEEAQEREKPKAKGHGRNGAEDYESAERREVAHESLQHGDPCPEIGCEGRVYRQEPGVLVRLKGQPPVAVVLWALEKLRCNLCGKLFSASAPEGVGEEKYDESAKAMIALLRYGSGFPLHRLEKLEGSLGIPLAASSQWEILRDLAELVEPAFAALVREAAQGEVLHNDDTPMRILELMSAKAARSEAFGESPGEERTGVFTTGIVSKAGDRKLAVYFTGVRHAGENLSKVLKQRAAELSPPIQMCDALSRNVPEGVPSQLANCLAHGRRKFVELLEIFPTECRTVLEELRKVYRNEARSRELGHTKEERLRFHQAESGPVLGKLETWLESQISERKVEPSSGLGQAIQYMLNHWEKLTLFLKVAGAPLDNNICERALKKAILHRKGSLFYKTRNGARVGDLFMSVIHSCELVGENAFEYLVALQKNAESLAEAPGEWMPWSYRATLARGVGS